MRDYKKIKAWGLADDLAVEIYRITVLFPDGEKYALTSQLRRAAYSVPSNIAEGAGRRTTKDFIRFLDISMGSANEVEYFCHLAFRLDYLSEADYQVLHDLVNSVSKCLSSYIRVVEKDITKG